MPRGSTGTTVEGKRTTPGVLDPGDPRRRRPHVCIGFHDLGSFGPGTRDGRYLSEAHPLRHHQLLQGNAKGERAAGEYVAELITEVGLEPQYFESAPGRANVFTRIEGTDPSADALLVHGHLDVVPALADDWSVDPFAGEVKDGMIWGRGAVDMKDMDAMMLSVMRHMARTGDRAKRDIVFGFFADEEAGMSYGSKWITQNHPELFDGVTDALSEVGGYSANIGGQRAYLLQTAEKGLMWLNLIAKGEAGHGSGLHENNAVTRLSRAMANIGEYTCPLS